MIFWYVMLVIAVLSLVLDRTPTTVIVIERKEEPKRFNLPL